MGLNIGGIIGGIVGSMLGIPGGAALGAGLGAKATGSSDKEAMMYGLGGLMLGGAGGAAGKMGGLFGKTGIMGGLLGKDKIGNALLMGSLASGAMGVMNPPSGLSSGEIQDRLSARWNALDTGESSDFVDPETGERYASADERDAAMVARGSTYNMAEYTPTDVQPLYAATGGYIQGPGTGTSDSIPAMIYQNGGPVRQANLSDGEFVMTEAAVKGMGGGDRQLGAARMYQAMNNLSKGYKNG
tara:strand:- start:287 stop:1015 length:729 start_codon:yes stop_codon:yes gene_type:complete